MNADKTKLFGIGVNLRASAAWEKNNADHLSESDE
jgi:hypothetical protein